MGEQDLFRQAGGLPVEKLQGFSDEHIDGLVDRGELGPDVDRDGQIVIAQDGYLRRDPDPRVEEGGHGAHGHLPAD